MAIRATVVTATGIVEDASLDSNCILTELQARVGGLVEKIDLPSPESNREITAWLHEEGVFCDDANPVASEIIAVLDDEIDIPHTLFGTVVFTACDAEGETDSLTLDEADAIALAVLKLGA